MKTDFTSTQIRIIRLAVSSQPRGVRVVTNAGRDAVDATASGAFPVAGWISIPEDLIREQPAARDDDAAHSLLAEHRWVASKPVDEFGDDGIADGEVVWS
jgi:hypothetical protein